ncbi:serine/threonine kinase-like domain-containing protein STKLD1 [Bombina bombina]|uniref:serine/threonine kinase-like domain-containing protein STKLD1 n=1 Tax=Bombina bombina TaxID=8345 RepID=UPI00235AD27D|nr:serine/threonine kinase-like domain-containing protein STKLD1 [Bombina bombina]
MEQYKVLGEWKSGVIGQTCIVEESQGEKRRFALKKVECIDERHANLVLNQAMELLKLQHHNVCTYKEFFMIWDNKISSLFFCQAMELCDQGSLSDIIHRNRQLKEEIDEEIIQKFLAQTIDALVYIHKNKIIHRNLKPNNILLKDATFLMSDFAVEKLMTDEMKIKTRLDAGCTLWMAPESLRCFYSIKSDVWSLGCILLDMMTCSSHTDAELAVLLQLIREDRPHLERVVTSLGVGYSADLSQALLCMLQINPEDRASVYELINTPYVKRCLLLIGSPLLGLKKSLPCGAVDELNEGGVHNTIEFMKKYADFEDAQISAIQHLSKHIAQQDGLLDMDQITQLVVQAMKLHSDSLDIQLEGGKLIQYFVSHAIGHEQQSECFTNNELMNILVQDIRSFHHNSEMLTVAFKLMMMLSANDTAAGLLGKTGVLQDIVRIMAHSIDNRELCVSCCGLLWGVGMAEEHSGAVWLKHAVPIIFTLIRKYLSDGQLVESACSCLWILCLKGCVEEKQIESVIWVLLDSLQSHPDGQILVKNACLALSSLIRASELAAFRLLVPVDEKSGLSIVKDLCVLHSDDPEVVENICLLFNEMAHYEDCRAEMLLQHLELFLQDIKDKYASTEEIVTLVQDTLSKLEK